MKTKRIYKTIICISLSFCLALLPFSVHTSTVFSTLDNSAHVRVDVQNNEAEAIPVAIPAAGAALAALAAELGISETALICGLCAIGVGATGLAIYNSDWTDLDNPPAPGWPAWNDLPPAVQDGYDYNDEPRAKNYHENAVAWWALQYGVIQEDGNGGFEPTPEPENNPGSWQKARNVLIALATGAGGVALNDALVPLVDNASSSIKDLLFGKEQNQLGLSYSKVATISDVPVKFEYLDVSQTFNTENQGIQYTRTITPNNWICDYYLSNGTREITFDYGLTLHDLTFTKRNYRDVYSYAGTETPALSVGERPYSCVRVNSSGTLTMYSVMQNASNAWTPYQNLVVNQASYLNAAYSGTYYFPNNVAYSNGDFISGNPDESIDYGQMLDTPNSLAQSIINPTNYNTFINNYTTDGMQEGYKRAIAIPEWLLNGTTDDNPSYNDFVNILPDEDITPIPDDNPLPGPGPGPNPPTQYEQDFGQQVMRLIAQPFDQLFPFCLIGDLRRLTGMIEDSIYGQNGQLRTNSVAVVNGTETFTIPLEGFGMEDVELQFDLTPVADLAQMIRPFLTALFITGILVGTFRFFLVRGGE